MDSHGGMQEMLSTSVTETFEFGKRLGRRLEAGDLVGFAGDLGAGKTSCIQGVAVGLDVRDQTMVTSPTYTLIHEYQGRVPVYHVDVYRLTREEEFAALGYEEYFYGSGVTLIEWADRILSLLPQDHLLVHLHLQSDHTRRICLQASGSHYQEILRSLIAG